MANVHIISGNGSRYTAVMHYAIPATNNAAGVSWQVVAQRNYGATSRLPAGDGTLGTISAAEQADLNSGAVVERVEQLKFGSNPSLAELDAIYATKKTQFLAEMQALYNRQGVIR